MIEITQTRYPALWTNVGYTLSESSKPRKVQWRLCGFLVRTLTAATILLGMSAVALALDEGNSEIADPIMPKAPIVDGSLERVIAVTPGHFPPQYDIDENGEATGFAIEIADRVAALAGLRFNYLIMENASEMQEALRSGLADVSPNIGISEARKVDYDFTAPVETFRISIFIRQDTNTINSADDLTGKKVAVERGHVGVRLLKKRGDVELVITSAPQETLFALLSGQVDALVYAEPVIMKVAREAQVDARIKIVGKPLLEVKRGMAVRKGNTVLLKRLDQAVNAFVGSPEYRAIYAKWYGGPLTSWTTGRIMATAGIALLLTVLGLAFWRYYTVVLLNRNLQANIAERKQVEKLNTRLGRIFEDSVNEIFVFDAQTLKFIQVNCGARKNLGYTMEELKELTAVDIKPDISREQFTEMVQPLRDGTQDLAVFTTVHERKDGSCYDVQVRLQLARNETPQVFFAIIEDITERKLAEDQIRQLNEDLERRVEKRTAELKEAQDDLVRSERMATLGQLTATVSHELRNPLGVVRASAFVLANRLKDEEPRTLRALERIERSVVRCDRIIDELVDFTRISEIDLEPTNLDAWLDQFLEEQILPPQVTIQQDFGLANVATSFDRDRFGRVIINVVDNACQAMIGIDEEESSGDHKLIIKTREANGRVEVVFEDNGPGISKENMSRIFEPLFSTKNFGVGLGLAVVRQIMEQHGGGIDIQSEPGQGARVTLWLAAKKQIEGVAA